MAHDASNPIYRRHFAHYAKLRCGKIPENCPREKNQPYLYGASPIFDGPGAADVGPSRPLRLVTVLSAGLPLRRDTKREIIEKISPNLFELYGFSEGFATMLKPDQHTSKFDTVGTPVLGFEVRILDDEGNEVPAGQPGEIAGYGAGIMFKYNNQTDLTKD